MKNNFDRTKTETSKLGTRSLALLMFFVMLFTAIGSGSVLSALAVTRGDEGADYSIAESVEVSEDFASSADLYDTEETMLGRKANLDLAATGLDGGDGIHLGIGTTSPTWHGMGDSAYEFTLNAATTIYYTFSCKGSNFGKGSSTNAPTAGSQETYTWYTDKTSSTQFSIALPAGTYKFKLKGIQSNNANCLEYQFWKVSGGSGGGGDDPVTPGEAVSDNDLIAVLKGEKVYIYHGDRWGSGTKYVMKGATTTRAASGTSEQLTIDSKDCHVAHSAIPVNAKYSISNSDSWPGMSINGGNNISATQAGYLYYIYSESYGNNTLVTKSSKPTVTWNTSSAAINPGAASSSIKATVSGNTGANRSSTVKYFYTADGTTFYTFDPANTSSFAPGTYTIYAAAYDTKIYVAAATTGTLTVLPKLASKLDIEADPDTLTAEGQSSTITVTASDLVSGQNNLTYTLYKKGTSSDTKVEEKRVTDGANTTTFTVTPNARSTDYYATVAPTAGTTSYDAVQSGTVTISNTDEQYVPTYTVTFSSSNTTYGTVTAKSTYKGTTTTLTSGDSVKEGASVTFTATEKTGGTFVNWSTFDTTATTVTRVIRAATTVQGVFGKKGYQIGYIDTNNGNKPNWLGDMKELPNGTYITSTAQEEKTTFTIKRNYDGKFSSAGAGSNTYWLALGDKATPQSWKQQASMTATTDYYYVNVAAGAYVVYDPATDQVWLTSEPDDLYGVTVIAKDGTIRYGYSTPDKYTSAFGDTTLIVTDGEGTNIASHSAYDGLAEAVDLTADQVRKGITLKVTTQVDTAHVASGYYVKGFVVSGYEESFSVLWQEFESNVKGAAELSSYDDRAWIHSGYNEFELTIDGYPEKNIEITPVYAIRENTSGENIRFYVEGFAGDVYDNWGGTLAIDAYNTSGDRKFGEYPGQPMINYNGRYVVDLPRSGVTGITLNNYVWDRIHSNLFYGTTGTATGHESTVQAVNYQTYDFNDFTYLKQRMDNSGEDEDMIFSFRYRRNSSYNTKATSQLGQSTYYINSTSVYGDDGWTSGEALNDYDYRKNFENIDPNDSIYQWEDLTDFYGNRVDIFGDYVDTKDSSGTVTNPKANYNPIRIVSNGYDYNEAGKYATAWAVYKPVDASGNLAYEGDYDHYELFEVYGGQGRSTYGSSSYLVNPTYETNLRDKYDYAYFTDTSKTHSGASFIFDLAEVPTLISYEFEVQDGFSNLNLENASGDGQPGYRSDGRWFTTSSDQLLTAHTIIEYAEKDDDSLYHRDYYQGNGIDYTSASGYDPSAHTGLATGIQAYFENSNTVTYQGQEYDNTSGDTEAYAISDGEHTFDLKAVGDPAGEYMFKGWYMYTNGKYSLVSRSETYASEATANDVYVARYYKVPSGNLNLTHMLDAASTGTGLTEIKAEIRDNSNTSTIYTYNMVENGPIVVRPAHIKQGSTNQLLITLRTTPDSFSEFEEFLEYINTTVGRTITDANGGTVNQYAYVDINTNSTEVTATIRFLISYLFDADGNQLIKSMPFTSKLKLPEYKYSIRYQYPAYNSDFGNQAYTVEGKFTPEELEKYMTIDNDHMLQLTTDSTKKQNFISNHAPYEDNFQQTLSFTTSGIDSQSYNKSNYTYTILIHSQNNTDQYVYPTFNFPYAVNDKYVAQESGSTGKIKMEDVNSITLSGRRIFEWVTTSGETSQAGLVAHPDNKPVFIKAPLIIYTDVNNESTARYFMYWSVETAADYTNMKMASREFTRCYDPEFNLSLFQDCTITPVYGVETFESKGMAAPVPTDNTEYSYSRFDPEIQQKLDSENGVTITFIENSRNQYNMGDCGNITTTSRMGAGDRVYSDFVLSYNNVAGGKLIRDLNDGKKCGLIIETVDDLRQEDGKYVVDDEEYYKDQYGDKLSTVKSGGLTRADIEAYIKGGARPVGCDKSEFNATELDNKNRIQYYYSLTNRNHKSGSDADKTMTEGEYNKNNHKVFRAYAYITDSIYTNITISEVPVYFTINEIGSIALGAPASN